MKLSSAAQASIGADQGNGARKFAGSEATETTSLVTAVTGYSSTTRSTASLSQSDASDFRKPPEQAIQWANLAIERAKNVLNEVRNLELQDARSRFTKSGYPRYSGQLNERGHENIDERIEEARVNVNTTINAANYSPSSSPDFTIRTDQFVTDKVDRLIRRGKFDQAMDEIAGQQSDYEKQLNRGVKYFVPTAGGPSEWNKHLGFLARKADAYCRVAEALVKTPVKEQPNVGILDRILDALGLS